MNNFAGHMGKTHSTQLELYKNKVFGLCYLCMVLNTQQREREMEREVSTVQKLACFTCFLSFLECDKLLSGGAHFL